MAYSTSCNSVPRKCNGIEKARRSLPHPRAIACVYACTIPPAWLIIKYIRCHRSLRSSSVRHKITSLRQSSSSVPISSYSHVCSLQCKINREPSIIKWRGIPSAICSINSKHLIRTLRHFSTTADGDVDVVFTRRVPRSKAHIRGETCRSEAYAVSW